MWWLLSLPKMGGISVAEWSECSGYCVSWLGKVMPMSLICLLQTGLIPVGDIWRNKELPLSGSYGMEIRLVRRWTVAIMLCCWAIYFLGVTKVWEESGVAVSGSVSSRLWWSPVLRYRVWAGWMLLIKLLTGWWRAIGTRRWLICNGTSLFLSIPRLKSTFPMEKWRHWGQGLIITMWRYLPGTRLFWRISSCMNKPPFPNVMEQLLPRLRKEIW